MLVVLWACLDSDVWRVGEFYGVAERDQLSTLRMGGELATFYARHAAAHPQAPLSQIGQLTLGLLGTRAAPQLHSEGAETEGLLGFACDLLGRHKDRIPSGKALFGAAEALLRFHDLLAEQPYNPAPAGLQVH